MLQVFLTQIWPYIAAAVVVLAGALGMYRKGTRSADQRHEARAAKDYAETRERMDEVSISDDDGVADRWLRERAKR